MPDTHARLSPSAAERWLSCPASLRLASTFPDSGDTSPYAREGTLAHAAAEIRASFALGLADAETTLARTEEWASGVPEDLQEEMLTRADEYAELLRGKVLDLDPPPLVLLERRVDTGVEGCWGTADALLVSAETVHVVDYKYGRGVRVDAADNPQLMLYGLGALHTYGDLLGDIRTVHLTVHQPRLDHVSSWSISAEELRIWRDTTVVPLGREALAGLDGGAAHFGPSEAACRWCPASGSCRAQTAWIAETDFGDPDRMSGEDYADALRRVPAIRIWLEELEKAALTRVYERGETIPGWKVVRSGGRRAIADHTAAIQTLIDEGYGAEQVAEFRTKRLGELEKLVGRAELPQLLGGLLTKSEGRPSLVPATDRREPITSADEAADDFNE